MAEPAHDFFAELQARLISSLGQEAMPAIAEAIAETRENWAGTQIHITRYTSRDEHIARLCHGFLRAKLEFCRAHNIAPSTLDKWMRGKAHRAKPGPEQQNLL